MGLVTFYFRFENWFHHYNHSVFQFVELVMNSLVPVYILVDSSDILFAFCNCIELLLNVFILVTSLRPALSLHGHL